MELLDAINQRRTVRDFSNDEVPFEIIKKSLESGLKAPSYNHLKQWDSVKFDRKSSFWSNIYTEKYICNKRYSKHSTKA